MSPFLLNYFHRSWWKHLREFCEGSGFHNIIQYCQQLHKEGVILTPSFKDVFKAFLECDLDKLNVVIMGMDPYPSVENNIRIADGLAFSSKYAKKCPKSLDFILRAIDEDIYNNEGYHLTDSYDLTKWANQGVLLLNSALTYPIGQKAGAHIELWKPFILNVIKAINTRDMTSIILMGKAAQSYKKEYTNKTSQILTCEHPSAANYRNDSTWNHENVFKHCDAFLKFQNINIKW